MYKGSLTTVAIVRRAFARVPALSQSLATKLRPGTRRASSVLICLALTLGAAPPVVAQGLRAGGTGSAIGTMTQLSEAFARHAKRPGGVTIVPNLGSSGALRAVQAGAIDIALVSRALKPQEKAAGLMAFEYGRTPFSFVTNKAGVSNVTSAQVADVLSGRVTAWPDGQTVRFVLRPTSDGDTTLLASMDAAIASALVAAQGRNGMVVAATDQDAAGDAENLPGSLAVNTLALLISEKRKLRTVAFNGVEPSLNALADGSYRFFKTLFLVTRGAPDGAAKDFIDFVKSPTGRAVLEANGHLVAR